MKKKRISAVFANFKQHPEEESKLAFLIYSLKFLSSSSVEGSFLLAAAAIPCVCVCSVLRSVISGKHNKMGLLSASWTRYPRQRANERAG